MKGLTLFALAGLLASLCTSASAAQPLADFCCVEDVAVSEGIRRAISVEAASAITPWQRARIAADRARRYLRSQGYFAAEIMPALGENETAQLRIQPGARFAYGEIRVETGVEAGVTARENLDARQVISETLDLSPASPYQAEALLAAERRGLQALQDAGWPDATRGERTITVDHARQAIDIILRYQPGPRLRLGQVHLRGDGWNEDYILGLSEMEPGADLRLSELQAYRARLTALESVSEARLNVQHAGEAGVRDIRVELEHAPRHVAEIALSYSTSNGGGATTSLNRRNLMGEDQLFTFRAQLQTLSQGVEASLSFPHWRRYGQTLLLSAGLQSQETDAFDQQEFAAGFNLNRALRDQLQYAVGAELDYSRVTNSEGISDAISVNAGLGLTLDARDDPLEPTRGYRAHGELVPTATFGDTNGQYVRVEASGSAYWRVRENWVLAARGRIGSLVGAPVDDIPADQRFYAGGGGSVRGFDYQGLGPQTADGLPSGGLSVAEAGLEMRWRDTSRWGGVVFVEAGTAGDDLLPAVDDMRAAVGVGVRYYLDFAPVRVDLATPLDRRDGETPVHLYFSIGQAF